MAVKQHKDKNGDPVANSWVIDYRPDGRNGKRIIRVLNDVTEGQARLIEKSLRRQRQTATAVNKTISEVLPDWLHWMNLHRSPKTLESIGWAIKHLEPHFGHYTVNRITEETFNQYKTKRRQSPRACNLEIDYLKSMISWMAERKMCDPLPFKVQRLPYKKPLPQIPTPAELNKWLAEIKDPQKRAMVDLMLYSGLRFKEVTHLNWHSIDLKGRSLMLTDTKGDRPRIAILPDSVADYLDTIDKNDRTGLAFPSPKPDKNGDTGKPYNNMKTMFKGASARSGVYIKGPHTLRHICGTYTLASSGNLRLVQTTLGHTQIRTTELYTQIEIGGLRTGQQGMHKYMELSTVESQKPKKHKRKRALKK